MLKRKTNLLLIILMIIIIALSPLSFADEENTNDNSDSVAIEAIEDGESEDVENDENEVEEDPDNVEDDDIMQALVGKQSTGEVKNKDEYLIGDTINVDNIIDGNLYVIANKVTINAQIVGNAFICANEVSITEQGYISSSLFVASNTLTIKGIAYDVYSACDSLTIEGYIFRDIHCTGKNLNIYGTIGRDAYISGENISFERKETSSSQEDGSEVESIVQGKIAGNLKYSAEHEMTFPEGVVEGKIKYDTSISFNLNFTRNYFLSTIFFVVLVILIWAILKWLAPKFMENSSKLLTNKTLKTVGFGLLGLITIPVVSLLLIITILAATVGLLLLPVYFVLICISTAVFIIALNNVLSEKLNFDTKLKSFLLLIVTSIIAKVITFIPVIGAICSAIFVIIGMGIIVRNLVSKKDKE